MVVEIQEIWYLTPYFSVGVKTGEGFALGSIVASTKALHATAERN
jgi:hypothetical protein